MQWVLQCQMHLCKSDYLHQNGFTNLCFNKVMSHKSFGIQKIQYPELPGVGISVVSRFLTSTVVRTGVTRDSLDKILSAGVQLMCCKHVL